MPNSLIRKLEGFGPLSDDDRAWLATLTSTAKEVGRGADIIREGDNPDSCQVILDGFAVRYKLTSDGRRQIFAYLVAGDFCDLHVAILQRMDHSIATISPCRIASISTTAIREMTEQRAELTRAFWWCSLVDGAVLREWLLNNGQPHPVRRIAHFFCELHVRMSAVGLTTNGSFDLPITQRELADTMGISPVHANRSLMELRHDRLLDMRHDRIIIPDVERLKEYSGFDPSYLHLRV